ncbi:MAG: hypothetical protein ACI87O_001614 [Planctomycetota bacterium]|jgi:hypothetical protein
MTLRDGLAHQLVTLAAWVSGAALIAFGGEAWTVSDRNFADGGSYWIIFVIAMIANGVCPWEFEVPALHHRYLQHDRPSVVTDGCSRWPPAWDVT